MKEILEVMERFHQLSLGEMELEYHGIKLFLKKEKKIESQNILRKDSDLQITGENSNREVLPNSQEEESVSEEKRYLLENLVTSPLAGTFYRASAPGEEPFILPGQKVKKGEILGVIEAMKMMNEIVAEKDGIVEEILVEDETMVEFEQPLIVIR